MNKEKIALEYIKELREQGKWHNWVIETQNEYIVDTADCCELAHEYTEQECLDKDIQIDRNCLKGEDETYTQEAQEIFDRHYDIITDKLGI